MGSFRVFNQRNGRLATLAALSVATLGQAFMPALASADQISDRSIALSSAAAKADDVNYTVKFTTSSKGTAGAFVIEFCTNTPLLGQSCSAPTGMDLTSASIASGATVDTTTGATTANKITVTKAGMATTTAQTVELEHVVNPDNAGNLYARIVTYDTTAHAEGYTSTSTPDTGMIDNGSVALSITDAMGVSGDVLETMQFCVSGASSDTENPTTNPIGAACADTNGFMTAPTLKLGEKNGDVVALTSSAVSTGTVWTQMSTNALGGAVVYLKSSAAGCGGLAAVGTSLCIPPLTTAKADTAFKGTAAFGVKLGTDTVLGGTGNSETFEHAGSYGDANYFMDYVDGDGTGVTSTYGSPILTTNGTQVNSQNMQMTFGASIAPNTPAGRYSADLSLIATGTF